MKLILHRKAIVDLLSHEVKHIVIILIVESTEEINDYYHDMKSLPNNLKTKKYSITNYILEMPISK